MNDESSPKGAHESATTDPSVTAGTVSPSSPAVVSSWPVGAMTFYGYGYLAGIDKGRELAEAEMACSWSFAFRAVQRQANGTPYAQHLEAVKAREIATGERNRAAARPWPDEAAA